MNALAANPIYESLAHGRAMVASDAHYKGGQFVSYRVDRRLRTETTLRVTPEVVRDFLIRELPEERVEHLDRVGYVDVGLDFRGRDGLANLGRIRVNARHAYARTALNLAVRFHAERIFRIDEYDLGDYVERELLRPHRGLDLISAPMGMAKTSFRCSLLQTLNERFGLTITSYEDPIELLLTPVKGSIEQIEIGPDVESFAAGGRALKRTDTDVVSYGELRDRETRRAAISAAKSMHVIGTSHASTAAEAIEDLIEGFPPEEQPEVRSGLVLGLHSVIVLRSLPRAQRLSPEQLEGRQNVRIVAEILHVTDGVRTLIRKAETHRIRSVQMGADREHGSRTLEAHLAQLHQRGEIDIGDPLVQREIRNRQDFEASLRGLSGGAA